MLELKKGLSEGYLKQLINIEDYIVKKNIEAQIAHRFPNYTLHDMDHYKQVAHNAGSLCEKVRLTEEERFCLLAACFIHDLGMSLSESALVEYYENRSQARRKHAERSALMVTNELEDEITNDDMREVIATICEGHGRDDLDSSDFDSQYKVNVRLLTCLLMFADSLDLRSGRRMPKGIKTDEQLMGYVFLSEDRNHDARIDKKTELMHLSRLHWLRHYYSTIPSIAQGSSPFPSVDILFRGTVGVEKDEDGKPIYIDKNKYLPDRRFALLEEIILSDPLETYELIKPYISNYLKVNIKNISSPGNPVMKVRYDPSKILFPAALVKTAYSAGLIRSREIALKDNNAYRKLRIEPFFCEDELQVSISWKIGTLVPASVSEKAKSIDRTHFRCVQAAARETWDIVLWRVDRYLQFIINKLSETKPELNEVSKRIESLLSAPQKILTGELKKVYLYHRESDYPYTTTKHISKHAIYDAKNGKISKKNLFGKVLICEREQSNGFIGLCKKIADKLNFPCEENDAPEFVKLLRNKRIGFLLSSKTIIELLQQPKPNT
ncbi:MAG: HD domain-containing protein, partial [Candidatus Electrothrix sp. AR3]|nr:HD domain-containing protein [Candidatus Electrothrix sp. AR3]